MSVCASVSACTIAALVTPGASVSPGTSPTVLVAAGSPFQR